MRYNIVEMSILLSRAIRGGYRICFSALLLLFLTVFSLSSQSIANLRLSQGEVKLSDLFSEIENQTRYILVVNIDRVDTSGSISVGEGEMTLRKILDGIKSSLGYDYTIKDKYIIIAPITAVERVERGKPELVIRGGGLERDVERFGERQIEPLLIPQYREVVHYDTLYRESEMESRYNYSSQKLILGVDDRHRIVTTYRPAPILSLKTNLLWAATLTPNLALEVGLGKRSSMELSGGNNRWNLKGSDGDNKKLVHWILKPEFRYWFCERFSGHYIGVHGLYGKYNIGGYDIPLLFDREYRYEGDFYGGGFSYGYHWRWTRSWGMEFSLSMGVAQLDYVKKGCEKCGEEIGRYNKTYFGPTGVGLKLVFTINRGVRR